MSSQSPLVSKLINAHQNQRWKEVLKIGPRALKKFPRNALAHILVAEAYAQTLDYLRAGKLLKKAEALSTKSPQLLRLLTQTWIKTRQLNRALPLCRKALDAGCDDSQFHFWHAKLLIQTGAPDEDVLALLNNAMDNGYLTPESLVEWAKLRARMGDPENALDRLQDALSSKFAQHQERWQLHHQSGLLLDRLGKYQEAMSEVEKGKELVAEMSSQFPQSVNVAQGVLDRLEQIRDSLNQEQIDRWIATTAEESQPEKISFICGLPRTGTTLLETILGAHSETILADETRLPTALMNQFLRRSVNTGSQFQRMDSLKRQDARKFIETYRLQTEAFIGKELGTSHLVDKSPDLSAQLPALLALIPKAQILIPTRDLRDNALSIFFALPQGPSHWQASLYRSLSTIADYYGIIVEILERLVEWYPDRCLQVPYESLVTQTDVQVGACLNHLSLTSEDGMLERRSAESTLQSPTLEASQALYQKAIGRWRNYPECFSGGRWEASK